MTLHKRFGLLCLLLMALGTVIAPVAAQDTAEIPVWIAFTDDTRLGWAEDRAAEFNEMFPQFNVTIVPYQNYEELFAAAALAAEQGNLPAIIQYFEVATQDARDSGYFQSIAGALGDRTEVLGVPVDFEDFIQPVVAYYTLDGEFTSMPWNVSSAVWFSNQDILDAAGVEAPPATWAEVEAACERIMALEDAPEYCFTFPNHGWFFEQWLAQQNALYANNENGRAARATEVVFDSEAGAAILAWLDEMAEKGYLYYSGAQGGASWDTVSTAFLGEQVAMTAYSSSDTTIFNDTAAQNGFEVVASRLPYNDETGWTGNLIGGASLWLVKDLPEDVEDGALAFLLWLTNTENMADWASVTGYFPIRTSSVELLEEQGFYEEHPDHLVAPGQIGDSEITAATQGALLGAFPAIRNVVTQAVDTVLLTDEDPAAVLGAAAEDANEILEEYNLLNAPEG